MIEIIPAIFLTIILFIAAVSDLRFHKIPNRLTFPTVIAGIIFHTCVSGWDGLIFSSGGVLLGFALLIGFYILGGTGAGDVKLMAAIGGFLGPKGVFVAFLFTAIIGGIYAIALLAVSGRLVDIIKRYWIMLKTFVLTQTISYIPPADQKKRPVLCYGVVIAIGTLLSIAGKLI